MLRCTVCVGYAHVHVCTCTLTHTYTALSVCLSVCLSVWLCLSVCLLSICISVLGIIYDLNSNPHPLASIARLCCNIVPLLLHPVMYCTMHALLIQLCVVSYTQCCMDLAMVLFIMLCLDVYLTALVQGPDLLPMLPLDSVTWPFTYAPLRLCDLTYYLCSPSLFRLCDLTFHLCSP